MDAPRVSAAVHIVAAVAAASVQNDDVYPGEDVLPGGLLEVGGVGVELGCVWGGWAEGGFCWGDLGLAEVAGEGFRDFELWREFGYWHAGVPFGMGEGIRTFSW